MSAPGWPKWLLIVAVLLLAEVGATGRGAQGADAPPKIAAFLKQCETSRRGAIAQLEHTLRGLQSQSATPQPAQIKKIEADLRAAAGER